ncbi:1,5-anhydro-D-fructose reductase [compost metagenome]
MTTESVRKIKWGIIGTGGISLKFAKDLAYSKDSILWAAGSRTAESAERFAAELGVPKAYGSYEELVADPEVDAVYIGTPHPFHKENAMLALSAGKAVLCEKPFTVNSGELAELVAFAREKNLFLMEAMWSRFIPAMVKVREWINAGKIGELRLLKADLGFRDEWNPEGRLLNPALGGGALLDVGIYPVSLSSMLFGPHPKQLASTVHIGETGVDEHFSLLLSYGSGVTASLNGAVRLTLDDPAYIYGTEGRIILPSAVNPGKAELYIGSELVETFSDNRECMGYAYEADEVNRCLAAGLTESPVMPLDESIEIMKLLDAVRSEWGLKYPGEK